MKLKLSDRASSAEVIGAVAIVISLWIHMGTEPLRGGNNDILIHVGQADLYVADGILEEYGAESPDFPDRRGTIVEAIPDGRMRIAPDHIDQFAGQFDHVAGKLGASR